MPDFEVARRAAADELAPRPEQAERLELGIAWGPVAARIQAESAGAAAQPAHEVRRPGRPRPRLALSLQVVASGNRAVEFRLDPAGSSILFGHDGRTLGWSELPRFASGFVTADAVELGGVRRAARIEPGDYAAIAFDLPAPAGVSAVSARVAGWLTAALPDESVPQPFSLVTEDASLTP